KSIYGDKLSSVLAVQYKRPKTFGGSVSLGLLGYSASLEGATKDQRVSAVIGFRDKNSRYLLNTLPTQGQYLPHFNDLQTYITLQLGKKGDISRTTLELLNTYAWNTYLIKPSTQETNFGTTGQSFKLSVAFDGSEQVMYNTYQGSAKITHRFNERHKAFFMTSYVSSFEREYTNLESGYRLCELVQDFADQYGNNKCSYVRDLGTYFSYARNSLNVRVFSSEYRSTYVTNSRISFQWGAKYSQEQINDRFSQYGFRDSADYVTVNNYVNKNNDIISSRLSSYISSEIKVGETSTFTLGVRTGWWSLNQQFLISPTAQLTVRPKWKKDFLFRFTSGIYRQPPFYREMRDYNGNLNTNLRAQSAFSVSASSDYGFQIWKRDFRFIAEVYYKNLWDVVPYDIDNVRIRYYAQNNAVAYATGVDFRLSGEFIKGSESWVSLGFMNTEEKISGDPRGYIPRPTNQLLTFGMFFQDYLPNNPTWKMFLNMQFGTGLPFGVPNNAQYRNAFTMPAYRRVDIGFSKAIFFEHSNFRIADRKPIQSIWLTLEVLNIFGINNTISYLWVNDVSGGQFAVPNTLSQRFFNLRGIVNF
ncbi:MAG: TonB-dependent receptor, partial [Cytophagales bacterium]|nr:TonB-dependent receptor [Cytophagales bacterium]